MNSRMMTMQAFAEEAAANIGVLTGHSYPKKRKMMEEPEDKGAWIGAHGTDGCGDEEGPEELWDVPDPSEVTKVWILGGVMPAPFIPSLPGPLPMPPGGQDLCWGCSKYQSIYLYNLPAHQFQCCYCNTFINHASNGKRQKHLSRCTGLPSAYHSNKCTC